MYFSFFWKQTSKEYFSEESPSFNREYVLSQFLIEEFA